MNLKTKTAGTILAIAGAAVLGVLLVLILVPRRIDIGGSKVEFGSFQETLRADGVLRSKERYTVTAFANGDIKRVSLKSGDAIQKGEKITDLFWEAGALAVRAPISGVISKVFRESAGPIARGEPIVDIVDPSRLEVMAELLTNDAIRLKAGDTVHVENWSGGKPLPAKVTRVSRAGFIKPSALGVEEERTEVIAELVDPKQSGLESAGNMFHVDMTFFVGEPVNRLKVPVGALLREGTEWVVFISEEGRVRKKTVQVEAIGEREASIKSGLSADQIVLVYPGDLVKEGSRIRVKLKDPGGL